MINGQAGVALATRRRVEAVIREHGYRRAASGGPAAIASGRPPENNRVELATSLVVRQSTAPPAR